MDSGFALSTITARHGNIVTKENCSRPSRSALTSIAERRFPADNSRTRAGSSRACFSWLRFRRPRRRARARPLGETAPRGRPVYLWAGCASRRARHHLRSCQPHQSAGNHNGRHAALRSSATCARSARGRMAARVRRRRSSTDRRRARVTLRMLLDHSSGLPGYVRLFESANEPQCDDRGMPSSAADGRSRNTRRVFGYRIHHPRVIWSRRSQASGWTPIAGAKYSQPLDMSTTQYCPDQAHAHFDSAYGGRPQPSGTGSSRVKSRMKTLP